MKHHILPVAALSILAAVPAARGQNERPVNPPPTPAGTAARVDTTPVVIDDFADVSRWTVVASDGAIGRISRADSIEKPGGHTGPALRLDFDFQRGSGYCIARRELDLPIPANFRLWFSLSGTSAVPDASGQPQGFRNDLEFKLYDQTGDNVWWLREPDFLYTPDWQTKKINRRQLDFAWGPGGGRTPLTTAKAIEFAVTAGSGGKGHVLLDELVLQPLPSPAGTPPPVRVIVDGAARGEVPADGSVNIQLPGSSRPQRIVFDFGSPTDFGGVILHCAGSAKEVVLRLENSPDGAIWEPWREPERVATAAGAIVRAFPDRESAGIAAELQIPEGQSLTITSARFMNAEFGATANGRWKAQAGAAPRGQYPRYFLGEQTTWSVFGQPGAEHEGLMSDTGAVEIGKGGPTLEPFIVSRGKLITWADGELSTSLVDARIPLPVVTFTQPGGLELRTEAFAPPAPDAEHRVAVRYTITNRSDQPRDGTLFAALRPFQVLPPWHTLNMRGGVSPGYETAAPAAASAATLRIGRVTAFSGDSPSEFRLAPTSEDDVVPFLTAPSAPSPAPADRLSGAMGFDFRLAPGQSRTVWVQGAATDPPRPLATPSADVLDAQYAEHIAQWRQATTCIALNLSPLAKEIEDTFYAQIGWILVNRDGPAIQPGSRTYDRTWIRDGALTATALLYTGHFEEVREFLDWFRPFQYETGKVPCCVDHRGPDPVPENDSHGQYLYAVATYYKFTGDTELLRRHWPNVRGAVAYIESLRAQRMTAQYRDGGDEQRAFYGLVPESISHEGYSAKPMHSYWDDFFTLRGLKDAVDIAEALGETADASGWAVLRDDFRRTFSESVALAMSNKGIDYVPGCVELGDFDATSTAVGLFPCFDEGLLPQTAVERTFEKYWEFFTARRDGTKDWNDYTPYENRIITAMLKLGRPERAHALMDWFMHDRRPAGWRQWGEIVWKDPKAPRFVGDMPHTWVGSDFLKAVRHLCVFERESDQSLVIGAGLPLQWLRAEGGVRIGDADGEGGFPTPYGALVYSAVADAASATYTIGAGIRSPGGVVIKPWFAPSRAARVTINGEAAQMDPNGEVRVRETPAVVRFELSGSSAP